MPQAQPVNTTSCYGLPPGETIFTFIPTGPHANKRRSHTIVIGSDPAPGDTLRVLVDDIGNKAAPSPPVEALIVITYVPIWNKDLALCIENVTPASVLVTEVRLIDSYKQWLEKSFIFFRGQSLLGSPSHSTISFPVDYLREHGIRSVDMFYSVQCMVNLRTIFVQPPVDRALFETNRAHYMDALIMILGALRGLVEVYLPSNHSGLFSKEDQSDISLTLTETHEDGTTTSPGIFYRLKRMH